LQYDFIGFAFAEAFFHGLHFLRDGVGKTGGRNPVGVGGRADLLSPGSPASDEEQPLGFGVQSL